MSEQQFDLTFRDLRTQNVDRCKLWHPGFPKANAGGWSGADWSNAMAGEAGEACNVVKKLRRREIGTRGTSDPPVLDLLTALGEELADTITYADLLATYYEIDLAEAITNKFNRVSRREGFPYRLRRRLYEVIPDE